MPRPSWLSLPHPNRGADPRCGVRSSRCSTAIRGARGTLAQLYDQIGECEHADGLRYESFLIAEHHFHDYGGVPNPAVLLPVMAARTERIRLGSGDLRAALPQPDRGRRQLRQWSRGRLVLGEGSGYLQHEFRGFGIKPGEKFNRFDEALSVVTRMLDGGRASHEGRFFRLDDVALNVAPVQRPHPPIYVAILGKAVVVPNALATVFYGAAGKRWRARRCVRAA